MKKFFSKQNIIFFAVFFAVLFLDQLSKILLTNVDAKIIGELLQFKYVENTGAAFSMLAGAMWVFIPITVVFVGLLLWFYFSSKKKTVLLSLAISMVTGGAVGNLIDRIVFGFVKDFVSISFFPAIFNIADLFITVGTILFIVYILFFLGKEEKNAK